MKELGRSTWNDTQHNIVDPYLSSMSHMPGSRKKPSPWKSIKAHTHTNGCSQMFFERAVLKNLAILKKINLCWGLFYVSLSIWQNKAFFVENHRWLLL